MNQWIREIETGELRLDLRLTQSGTGVDDEPARTPAITPVTCSFPVIYNGGGKIRRPDEELRIAARRDVTARS
jgi:hypothetical protein